MLPKTNTKHLWWHKPKSILFGHKQEIENVVGAPLAAGLGNSVSIQRKAPSALENEGETSNKVAWTMARLTDRIR
jgi:hypothetical protein